MLSTLADWLPADALEETAAVFRNGTWYLDQDDTGGPAETEVNFGIQGDLPVVGYFNGDADADLAVFRNGKWFFDLDNQGGAAEKTLTFGVRGDMPFAGRWTDLDDEPHHLRYFELGNHPDGRAAAPAYGLRLDELFDVTEGHDIFTFDFDHPLSQMRLIYDDGGTPGDANVADDQVTISGQAFGGLDTGDSYNNPLYRGLWKIEFLYTENFVSDGQGGVSVMVHPDNPENQGIITPLFDVGGNDALNGLPIHLIDEDGGKGFSFKFNNYDEHRLTQQTGGQENYGVSGPEVYVGWGWVNHGDNPHVAASDWLFTATAKSVRPAEQIAVVRINCRWLFDLDGRGGNAEKSFLFGILGDQPVAGDFDGNGITDAAVFRNGKWFFDLDGQGGKAEAAVHFGSRGDRPVVGDWDGDGIDEIAVVRDGLWFFDLDGNGGAAEKHFRFGLRGDIPVSSHWGTFTNNQPIPGDDVVEITRSIAIQGDPVGSNDNVNGRPAAPPAIDSITAPAPGDDTHDTDVAASDAFFAQLELVVEGVDDSMF